MPIPISDWLPVSGPSRPLFHTLGRDARALPWAATAREVMRRVTPRITASFLVEWRMQGLILRRSACDTQGSRTPALRLWQRLGLVPTMVHHEAAHVSVSPRPCG